MTKKEIVYHDKAKLAKLFERKEKPIPVAKVEPPLGPQTYLENLEGKLKIAVNCLKDILTAKGAGRDALLIKAQIALTNISTYDERRNGKR